jgi:hypothetical protein
MHPRWPAIAATNRRHSNGEQQQNRGTSSDND